MNCKHCNKELPKGAQFCTKCGALVEDTDKTVLPLPEDITVLKKRRCQHCYTELSNNDEVCPNCGNKVFADGKNPVYNKALRPKKRGSDFLIWLAMLVCFVIAIVGVSMYSDNSGGETPEDLEYVTYRLDDGDVIYIDTFGYKDDIIYEEEFAVIINIKDWEQELIDEWIDHYDTRGEMGEDIEEFEYNKEINERQIRFEFVYKNIGNMKTIRKFADAGFEEFEGYGLFSMSGTEENLIASGYFEYEYR